MDRRAHFGSAIAGIIVSILIMALAVDALRHLPDAPDQT